MSTEAGAGLLPEELQQLLDRWVGAVEGKDLDALRQVFRCDGDLVAAWSNGERNLGWAEIRRHLDSDFRKDVALRMELQDVRLVPLGESAGVLSYRYSITLADGEDALTCRRLASMAVHRDAAGWRVVALHVSTAS